MGVAAPRRRRVSMVDVARHAGVSQKTVSRVVNEERYVTDEVRERVQASIDELGFHPNDAARTLVTRRSRRIGVVSMGTTTLHGPTAILAGIEEAVQRAGYALSIVRTAPGGGAEIQAAVDALAGQGVEAIVLSEPVDFSEDPLRIPDGIEVLTFSSEPMTSSPREFTVASDEFAGARDAVWHLLDSGAKSVDHIAGPRNWLASRNRTNGWRVAHDEYGATPGEQLEGDWSPASGRAAMTRLLDRGGCTAVFVANDFMAIGAMSAITDAGLTVPDDIAIVGFDDTDIAPFLTTPLSSVHRDFGALAHAGMRELLARLDGKPPIEAREPVPSQLVIRASSAKN